MRVKILDCPPTLPDPDDEWQHLRGNMNPNLTYLQTAFELHIISIKPQSRICLSAQHVSPERYVCETHYVDLCWQLCEHVA